MFSARRYPEDIRSKAIEAVDLRLLKNPRDRTIYREVASEFGIGEQSLRLWIKKQRAGSKTAETPSTAAAPLNSDELTAAQLEAEVRTLRRRVEKLQAENDVLKKAFVVLSSEWEK